MNPKINGVSGGSPRIEQGKPANDPGRAGKTPVASSGADQVSLTDSARLMVRLEKILEDVPAVDRHRVETIKQAIADGTYSIDAEKVAKEVLRMEMDLQRR